MSRDFIGSKIAIITKSQCRYVGTIIGIDAQTSSILLGNVKCCGTENRSGQLTSLHMAGTTLPMMQFANSDIEDLKIVDEETGTDASQQQARPVPVLSPPLPSSLPPKSSSIHDDPAIVSAVVSAAQKDSTSVASASSRLANSFQQMMLSDDKQMMKPKLEESRIQSNSGESLPAWPLISSSISKADNTKASIQPSSEAKTRFFDMFTNNTSNNANRPQINRSQQRTANASSYSTLRDNSGQHNGQQDDSGLPVRQPFFSDDNPYPAKPQQQNRYHNDSIQNKQRYFHNNYRSQKPRQQRFPGGKVGGNRETFQSHPDDYDNDFDFETNNRKFHKLTNDEDVKHENDPIPLQSLPMHHDDNQPTNECAVAYDKKKSFFDNLAVSEQSDGQMSNRFNRSNNHRKQFHNDAYQYHNNRSSDNGYRRSNNNNYRQYQQGNDDFHYKQHNNNKNGYHYRY